MRRAELRAVRFASLVRAYAAGLAAWRDIRDETGCAFGDVLEELGRQGLQLPRVAPAWTLQQRVMFAAICDRARQNDPSVTPESLEMQRAPRGAQ